MNAEDRLRSQDASQDEQNDKKRSVEDYRNDLKIRSVFSCSKHKFELLEDKKRNIRIFRFSEPPTVEVKAMLLEAGFRYESGAKQWTIEANSLSRVVSVSLANELSAEAPKKSMDR